MGSSEISLAVTLMGSGLEGFGSKNTVLIGIRLARVLVFLQIGKLGQLFVWGMSMLNERL
jgi:hypothetical protein